jgi:hypothetical protein
MLLSAGDRLGWDRPGVAAVIERRLADEYDAVTDVGVSCNKSPTEGGVAGQVKLQ